MDKATRDYLELIGGLCVCLSEAIGRVKEEVTGDPPVRDALKTLSEEADWAASVIEARAGQQPAEAAEAGEG